MLNGENAQGSTTMLFWAPQALVDTQLLLIWANLPVNQCSKEIRMMFGAKELHADQELMHGNSSESS